MSGEQLKAETLAASDIPAHMHEPLMAWVNQGRMPGSFLRAVLENDLMEAVWGADNTNIQRLKAFAQFLYNDVPGGCYGSKEKVAAWARKFEAPEVQS